MDQPKWLKLSALGLFVLLLGLTYFVIVGRFSANKQEVVPTPSSLPEGSVKVVAPSSAPIPTPTPKSAYQTLNDRNQTKVDELPNTGFPTEVFGILSLALTLTGWGLRKFPS